MIGNDVTINASLTWAFMSAILRFQWTESLFKRLPLKEATVPRVKVGWPEIMRVSSLSLFFVALNGKLLNRVSRKEQERESVTPLCYVSQYATLKPVQFWPAIEPQVSGRQYFLSFLSVYVKTISSPENLGYFAFYLRNSLVREQLTFMPVQDKKLL